MGAENDAMLSFLEDNRRFADLFNQLCFNGRQVVDAGELVEASEVYHGKPGEKSSQRIRDIKKRLRSGKELKILAVESQSDVSYIMPWRMMDYDCREYGRQIREAQRANEMLDKAGEKIYANAGERLCMVRKDERFAPVYTLCLYHGVEDWDGPRSLKDMVDFGDEPPDQRREWETWTSLGKLFALLPCRRNKRRLRELLDKEPSYQEMDEETATTVSVLLGIKAFGEKKKQYQNAKGEYDMCQAIREMMEDSRLEGIAEGEAKGANRLLEVIDSISERLHCSLENAREVAGVTLDEYNQAKALCEGD